MAIDIRADIKCKVGDLDVELISASVSDDYVQGSGLVRTKGTASFVGVRQIEPGTEFTVEYRSPVELAYTTLPRYLLVLSCFSDPFRKITEVELGCPLTYAEDLRPADSLKPTTGAGTGYDQQDSKIITIPILAKDVADRCIAGIGIGCEETDKLSNKFSVDKFDLSAGYVNVLSDLLVSECLLGFYDAGADKLRIVSLDNAQPTASVLIEGKIIDVSKIGVGRLPGDAVAVTYSTKKLRKPEASDEDNGWEEETTYGLPETVQVTNPFYTNNPFGFAMPEFFEYTYVPKTVTRTTYDDADRVASRVTTNYTIMAAIAPGYVQHVAGVGLTLGQTTVPERLTPPIGSNVFTTSTGEYYEYEVDASTIVKNSEETGNTDQRYQLVKRLVTRTSEPYIKLFASTQIYDYAGEDNVAFTYRNSDADRFMSEETIRTVESGGFTQYGKPTSKSVTETYMCFRYTQRGQQEVATALDKNRDATDFYDDLARSILDRASGLVYQGAETVITTGATDGRNLEQRPAYASQAVAKNNVSGSPSNGYSVEDTAQVEYAVGGTAERVTQFAMPYAPDDIFVKVSSSPVAYDAIASDAPQKAAAFGRIQNKLLIGNRFGMNIQTAASDMPPHPFARFYLSVGGVAGAYCTNGTTYQISGDGILAATDALLLGGAGAVAGASGGSFFPRAQGVSLPTIPAPVNGELTVDTLLPFTNETVPLNARLRVGVSVQSLVYPLQLLREVPAYGIRLGVGVTRIKKIEVPAASVNVAEQSPMVGISAAVRPPAVVVGVAAVSPAVSVSAAVAVPVAGVAVAAVPPIVVSGASVAVPAAEMNVTGQAPISAGPPPVAIEVPSADIGLGAATPVVSLGAAVVIPTVNVGVAGQAPTQAARDTDPYFSSVSLLLNMNGANNSTTFTDSSPNVLTVTANGNAKLSTAQSKFGGASGYFDGVDDYLSITATTATDLSGDFTIEAWVRPASFSSTMTFLGKWGSSQRCWLFSFDNANQLTLVIGNNGAISGIYSRATPSTLVANTWYHIAASRSGSTTRVFVDGVQAGASITDSGNNTGTQVTAIGINTDGNVSDFNGYIDSVRITKGVSRYNANFTPPTAQFPDS